MPKSYFEQKQEENKSILLKLVSAVFRGLIFISTIRIDKNMTGGYRLVAFFDRKDK